MQRPVRVFLTMAAVVAFAAACGGDPSERPRETGALPPAAAPKAAGTAPESRTAGPASAPRAEPPPPAPITAPKPAPSETPTEPSAATPPAPSTGKPVPPVTPPAETSPPAVEKPPAPEEPKAPPESEPAEPKSPPVPAETPKPPSDAPPPTPTPATPAGPRWKDAFVGPAACKSCHFKEAKAWAKSTLAKSMDALRPTAPEDTVRFAAKKRAGLDLARDYTSDATCLACHTTGRGGEGGYPADPSASAADTARAAAMGSVSCESCHGPGARYAKFKSDALAANPDAKISVTDLTPLGLVVPDAAVCATCHNDRNPTHADDAFDFEAARKRVHPVKK